MDIQNYKTHFRHTFNTQILLSTIDFHDLPNLVARTMQAVNVYNHLNDDDKYQLIIDVLTTAINNSNKSVLKKNIAINQIDVLINNFIGISKGSITVNKKELYDPNTINLIKIGDDIYNKIKNIFNKNSNDELINNLPSIVTNVIIALNKIKKLKGIQKKQIAIKVIHKLLDELPLSRNSDEDLIKIKLYKKTASSLIDASIAIANGKININKFVEIGFNLFKICCSK